MSFQRTTTLFKGTAYIMESIEKGFQVSEVAHPQQSTKNMATSQTWIVK
jgi:hypothetical protein